MSDDFEPVRPNMDAAKMDSINKDLNFEDQSS